ncbi:hypothetical protein MesoLjLb_33130 [Mesorhizobium sp. L-8-3]|nr:hypothetical protein MesoLjLb_33130 [Mesorhizobium sp. L-8-3]
MARKKAPCPVCKQPAQQSAVRNGDYGEVTCSDCGQFRLSRTLQQLFAQHPMAVRRQSLARARLRAPYGSVPLVTTYDLP